MHISEFDYELPAELIAQQPLAQRDASRMLVLNRADQCWVDSGFTAVSNYLRPNDVLVLNNTRVFPARLIGQRDPSGGRVEVLLVREVEPAIWKALVRPAHRLKEGARLRFGDSDLRAEVLGRSEEGLLVIKFEGDKPLELLMNERGETPLPPYIRRPPGTSLRTS